MRISQVFLFSWLFLFILPLPGLSSESSEGLLNKLLAPGPLIEGHKNLEEDGCLSCHEGGKGVPNSKCLDCHKEIKHFVDRKSGFHGLRGNQSCRECHSEHKGRTFDPLKFDTLNFNHKETGFELTGKHAEIKCEECHTEKRAKKVIRKTETRWFGLSSSCVSCHKKDDVHFFKPPYNKKDCNSCHGTKSWTENVKFDHLRETKYELKGKHAELKCAECHVPRLDKKDKTSIYKWPKLETMACLSCHENQHANQMSKKYQTGKCDTCHTQSSFKIDKFDHSVTGYKLRERHAEIKCQDCHKQKSTEIRTSDKKFIFKGLKTDCLSCHKDFHLFGTHKSVRLKEPNNCIQCHNERDWKKIHDFLHNQDTRYTVDGEHEKLKCSECHIPQMHKKPPEPVKVGIYFWKDLTTKTCENCHESPHRNEFSPEFLRKQCTECHVTSGWKDKITGQKFDHSKTRFPLTDRHAELRCNECHVVNGKQVFKFKSVEQKFCIDCHDNPHRNQFHSKFSSQSCVECHSTKTFAEIKPFNHDLTAFPLKGEHKTVKCEECHKPTKKKFPAPSTKMKSQFLFPDLAKNGCVTCHSDVHKGQFEAKCTSCHSEKGWKPANFNHNTQSRFELRGAHKDLKCSECHKPTKSEVKYKERWIPVVKYKPMGMQCIDCHEDVHKGQRGNRCTDCHTEKNWESTRDFHKNFTLSGVHYALACNECHTERRKLTGLSGTCLTCHQKDDVHNGALPNCGDCHRQQFWENAEFKHSMSRFPLRGAHRTLNCVDCHSRGIYQGTPSTCVSCHLQDALAVTTPNHAGFPNLQRCTDCHRNQFSFSGGN